MAEFQNVAAYIKENADIVEKALKEKLSNADADTAVLWDAMAYSTLGGGKKIRATLTLEFCRMFGGEMGTALDFACAVEMIQSFSLIHDDLPCMDDDDMRRGKPSCHIKYGEADALLAGDALVMLAFESLADTKTDAHKVLKATKVLSHASGAYGMCGGQCMDIAAEQRSVSLDYLEKLQSLKTGALICASAELGCIAAGADAQKCKDAYIYAMCIGRAFQIVDNILDVEGDEATLGKPIGSDAECEKTTFVTALGIEGAKAEAARLTKEAQAAVGKYEGSGLLCDLAELLLSRKS